MTRQAGSSFLFSVSKRVQVGLIRQAALIAAACFPAFAFAQSHLPGVCSGGDLSTMASWQPKIIRGERALISGSPWAATIAVASPERSEKAHRCGAVALGQQWLLTAGHCVWDCMGSEAKIVAYSGGDVYGDRVLPVDTAMLGPFQISKVFVQDDFKVEDARANGWIPRNDIALVKLTTPLPVSPNISIARVSGAEELLAFRTNGELATVAGYGRFTANGNPMKAMQKMSAGAYDDALCNLPTVMDGALVPEEMICVGDADSRDRACKGDSGSGLVDGQKSPPLLYGLVSWKRDCDSGSGLGAYTNVSNYQRWIDDVMKSNP